MSTDFLVIIRLGASSIHKSWIHAAVGCMDVVLSIYDDTDISEEKGVLLIHYCKGGKYQAVASLFSEYPWMLDKYKYFWFLDDDIYVPGLSLRRIKNIVGAYQFVLSQPALSPDSFFSWPMTVANSNFLWRATDFVEIMCPIVRVDFMKKIVRHMSYTITGYGQEFIWRSLLNEIRQFAVIIDAAVVAHTRAVGGGGLYKNYADGPRGAVLESLQVLKKLGISPNADFKQFYGLLIDEPQVFLTGEDFLNVVLRGYEYVREYSDIYFDRCILDAKSRVSLNPVTVLDSHRRVANGTRWSRSHLPSTARR